MSAASGPEPEVLTAREALFAIKGAAKQPNVGAAIEEVRELADEGLRRTGIVNFELSDQLADRFAAAYKLLRELREGGDVATLSGEIDEALALPPDIEAMVDRRTGR
jgi:hypothetical protein